MPVVALTVGALAVVAGLVLAIVKVISIIEVQADSEHGAALFLSIYRGRFESIAQGKALVDLAMTIVLTGDCSPIDQGDRQRPFNGDRGIRNAGHFGSEVPGKRKQRIEASCIIRVSNIGQGFVASASVLANLYDVVWKGCVAFSDKLPQHRLREADRSGQRL